MAVRFTDGFDLYTQLSDLDDNRQWFNNTTGDTRITVDQTGGKYGGGALRLIDTTQARTWHTMKGSFSSQNLICLSFLFRTGTTTKPSASDVAFVGISDGKTTNDTFVGTNADYPCIGLDTTGRVGI